MQGRCKVYRGVFRNESIRCETIQVRPGVIVRPLFPSTIPPAPIEPCPPKTCYRPFHVSFTIPR